jgi:glycine hydroxymethyltransferase
MLVDLTPAGITGKDAEKLLEGCGITVNKNAIPNDPQSPLVTSGIRVGSPAITTRGFDESDARQVGELLGRAIFGRDDEAELDRVRADVRALVEAHPLYPEL